MIVSHLLLILHKKIQFYIFMIEAWNVAKGRKVEGDRILSQGTVGTVTVGMTSSMYLLSMTDVVFSSMPMEESQNIFQSVQNSPVA